VTSFKPPRLLLELSAEFAGNPDSDHVRRRCHDAGRRGPDGNHDSISWAWGFGVVLGVYTAARISGAHLNPAVTLALATFKGFPWRSVLPYWLAQVSGAFVAALLVRWNYSSILAKADPGHTFKTQLVFSTLPGNGTLPVKRVGCVPRPDHRYGTAAVPYLRSDRPQQRPATVQSGALDHRHHCRRHRYGMGS